MIKAAGTDTVETRWYISSLGVKCRASTECGTQPLAG